MRFYANHGVVEQEKMVGNWFTVDLALRLNLCQAMQTDNLTDTINYAEVYTIVEQQMKIPSKLLEHLGGRIIDALVQKFPNLRKIELRVTKQNPPFKAQIEGASVFVSKKIKKPRLI